MDQHYYFFYCYYYFFYNHTYHAALFADCRSVRDQRR